MSDKPNLSTDPNPVFQDVIDASRRVYATLTKGRTATVSASLDLLERQDPRDHDGPAPLERVKAWASALGFGVDIMEAVPPDMTRGGNRYGSPAQIRVTVRRR